MTDAFHIGISALVTSQRQLSTTGHNIANANTEGYSRQRVEQIQRPPQFVGDGFVGKGVSVARIERFADNFLIGQLRSATTNEAQASAFVSLASQVDSLLGDGTFPTALEGFSAALEDANDDPSSIPARSILLDSARSLAARFAGLEADLGSISRNVNDVITTSVNDINTLTTAIADINGAIVKALGVSQGQTPNDLLDQRDALVQRLAKLTSVTLVEQPDGALNVSIGSGQSVVQGEASTELQLNVNPLDASQLEVTIDVGGSPSIVSNLLTSGEIGAALEFRRDMIEPARNAIGRLAATIATAFNEQHRDGMDLNGVLGGDIFAISPPNVNNDPANTGTISVTLDTNNIGSLTVDDYRLSHDGTDFTLMNLTTNATQTLSGPGPFNVDGMIITVTGAPAAGDNYLVQPTKYVARNMDVLIRDPRQLALAMPVRAEGSLTNISDATIATDQILDVTDPQLLTTTQFVFNDPPTTYQINGAGPLIPYTSGADIDVNGWRVQIAGVPEPGDTFTVSANTGGVGDNANGLALTDTLQTKLLENGTASIQGAYGMLVGQIGSKTQQTMISRDALVILRDNAEAARNELSGVNLDEEAGNLLRFQQAYQAAAQIISAADEMFKALIAATRT